MTARTIALWLLMPCRVGILPQEEYLYTGWTEEFLWEDIQSCLETRVAGADEASMPGDDNVVSYV